MWRSDGLRRVTAVAAVALLAVLVLGGARPAEATFPGTTNGKIVFDRAQTTGTGVNNPEGDSEIFTINDNGTGLFQITSNAANDSYAEWAPIPHQQKIEFASRRETPTNPIPPGQSVPDFDIYVMDGDEPESVTNPADQLTNNTARDTRPTWSPDGTGLAFMSNRGLGDNEDIYVMNAVDTNGDNNGENLKRLTKHAADEDYPAWSPNGTRIAFQSHRVDDSARKIFVIKPKPEGKRNRPVNLTRSSGDDITPSWSPDGTVIAFASSRGLSFDSEVGFFDPEIYLMALDGTNQIPLTENQAISDTPVWSPDGSKIAFVRSVSPTDEFDIFVMGSDGSSPGNITNSSASSDFDPDWQPLP
jgi:dipeptidyl aminopeptidase/acylaminoacyl peptidase